MKIKLSLVFLTVAIAVSFLIFNFRSFQPKDAEVTESAVRAELTSQDVVKFFDDQKWVDYQDKAAAFKLAQIQEKKAVYVHLWASWCGPCLNEIPELISYARKNRNSVQFVVVSLDESAEALDKFLKSFPELNDPLFIQVWDKSMAISKKFNADRLPMTIFIPLGSPQIKTARSVVDWKNL